jgi:fluoride ion exporter CrcB/FEX
MLTNTTTMMKNIKTIKQATLLALSAVIIFPTMVFAVDGETRYGPATQYEVTLKKVELCTDSTCATAHTMVTKTMPMDIASVSVGAEVGTYATTMTLPPWGVTYTHMRSTVDRTFNITGYAASSGTSGRYCYTDGSSGAYTVYAAGTFATTAATAAANATASALEAPTPGDITVFYGGAGGGTTTFSGFSYDTGYVVDGDNMLVTTAMTKSYIYKGITPLIDVSFATSSGVSVVEAGTGNATNDCNLFPGPPTMTITIK